MKQFIFLTFALYIIGIFSAQSQIDQRIIAKVSKYPSSYRSYENLSEQINADFKSKRDKAAAIYTWMAQHIAYDAKGYFSGKTSKGTRYSYGSEAEKLQKEQQIKKQLALETLRKKKAVCQGYSELYRLLCKSCGINCEVITGYSKTQERNIGNKPKRTDHAWNAVQLNNSWYLVDVTWGAGHLDYKKRRFVPHFTSVYFALKPEKFVLNHFPENTRWTLCKTTLKQFIDLPLYHQPYLLADIKMNASSNGIIKTKKFTLNIDGKAQAKDFSYAFQNSKYATPIKAVAKNGRLHFSIPVENRRSGYLTFYYRKEALVTYRIKR